MSVEFSSDWPMQKKTILLLGSGELGKEFVIAAKRYGQHVVAVDHYAGAPAMQVADAFEVINMLDGASLDAVVAKHRPDLIVPEIEAIRTERFYDYEAQGIQVVPSAKAANFTMNRRAIRDLAAKDLGLPTAPYRYASGLEELQQAVAAIGLPCVVKPLMSSSGKGQSTVRSTSDIEAAWQSAASKGRGDMGTVIVEGFIRFSSEITLLTVTQKDGPTLFCPPIGHRQERGDYQESWQPAAISAADLASAQSMADRVTHALGGAGIWGVEFFITDEGVIFSELSPRPHDTGMVTLANTQPFNEFELHCRAVLGLPIPPITLDRVGASAVILANGNGHVRSYDGLEAVAAEPKCDFRIFGKETARPYRRMAVVVTHDNPGSNVDTTKERAMALASKVRVVVVPHDGDGTNPEPYPLGTDRITDPGVQSSGSSF
jgi:phosphoribosylglycinamide formyltransferase 2